MKSVFVSVPYRGMPRYNSKRRLARRSPAAGSSTCSSGMSRTKSFMGSAAASECGYGTMRGPMSRAHGARSMSEMAGTPTSSVAPSPSIVRHSAAPCLQHPHMDAQSQQYGVPFGMQQQQQQQQLQHRPLHHTQSAMPAFSGNQTMPSDCRPAVLQMIKKSISEQNAVATVRGKAWLNE